MAPKALITGITGQDGSYLAEFLLDRGYEVIGLHRRTSTVTFERIMHLVDRLTLVPADRGVQPGRSVLRADLLRPTHPDRRGDGPRGDSVARRHPAGRSFDSLLP